MLGHPAAKEGLWGRGDTSTRDISKSRMLLFCPRKKDCRSIKGAGVVKGGGEERKKMCSWRGQPKRGAASTQMCWSTALSQVHKRHFSRSPVFCGCTLVLVHCLKRSIPAWESGLPCAETICALNRRAKHDWFHEGWALACGDEGGRQTMGTR